MSLQIINIQKSSVPSVHKNIYPILQKLKLFQSNIKCWKLPIFSHLFTEWFDTPNKEWLLVLVQDTALKELSVVLSFTKDLMTFQQIFPKEKAYHHFKAVLNLFLRESSKKCQEKPYGSLFFILWNKWSCR